jgi:single-stranded-DNA-specific exonuclease
MKNQKLKWETLSKTKSQKSKVESEEIINILLENRGIKTKKQRREFFNPIHPNELSLQKLGVSKKSVEKAIKRVEKAIKNNEQITIYGDYDADGICATAILWETLYCLTKNVKPYIPDRFTEGYGLNADSISKLKKQNPQLKLIITVDNGIVASKAVEVANGLGIDVIVTDHHQKEKKLPKACAIIHSVEIGGSGVSWLFAKEIRKRFKTQETRLLSNGLELAAIGTIADQMSLLGPNRSFAKFGLEILNQSKRTGLLALFEEAGIKVSKSAARQELGIGTYEVNFIIAPRINAMGRLEHAIDSLRLLCTKNGQKAKELAAVLGITNRKRQTIVNDVVLHARKETKGKTWKGAIVISHETYHEGVIGLAASKLVGEFGRPAVVFSKGKKISKASARSVSGFNIIESIKSFNHLIMGGGGHPMAAGFSIKTDKIETFKKEFEELTSPLLTDEVLTKKTKIDTEVGFGSLGQKLMQKLAEFEPNGMDNPTPVFVTRNVSVVNARAVGVSGKHLKLVLKDGDLVFNAIAFGKGEYYSKLAPGKKIDIAYNLVRDLWNGNNVLQLQIKDLRLN